MCGYLFTLPVGFCLFVVFVIDSVCALVVIWLCLLVNSVVVGQSFVLKSDGLIGCCVYLWCLFAAVGLVFVCRLVAGRVGLVV